MKKPRYLAIYDDPAWLGRFVIVFTKKKFSGRFKAFRAGILIKRFTIPKHGTFLGKKIDFFDLPEWLQKHVWAEYNNLWQNPPVKDVLPDSITVSARDWFDRVNGNSYFSGIVTETKGNSHIQYKLEFQYGYGDSYLQAAAQILGIKNTLSVYCRENGIKLYQEKIEVKRQRDCKNFISGL